MTYILFLLGLILLVGGAEVMVRGAIRIAAAVGISPLVIGLTVVAFGTSAPELAVAAVATLRGDPDLALGNVVGSNILNVLLILGLSAAVAPLLVQRRLVRLEVPFMIGVSVLVMLMALDRSISAIEGVFLVTGGIVYTVGLVVQARRSGNGLERKLPALRGRAGLVASSLLVVAGLVLLTLGSHWIVVGAQAMAAAFGVPDLVIGLTVVSVGTSLPELATSVVASIRGERDLAVGNIVGSNIFNLMIILGTAAVLSVDGLDVPLAMLTFDLPVMLAVALVCLPIFFTGQKIDRAEGLIFVGFYVAYTAYLVLDAANHHALSGLRDAVLLFGLPMTVLILVMGFLRQDRPE